MAQYITSILKSAPQIIMSWGYHQPSVYKEDGMEGLRFRVQGFKHTGYVAVLYNPGSDYFEVELQDDMGHAKMFALQNLSIKSTNWSSAPTTMMQTSRSGRIHLNPIRINRQPRISVNWFASFRSSVLAGTLLSSTDRGGEFSPLFLFVSYSL